MGHWNEWGPGLLTLSSYINSLVHVASRSAAGYLTWCILGWKHQSLCLTCQLTAKTSQCRDHITWPTTSREQVFGAVSDVCNRLAKTSLTAEWFLLLKSSVTCVQDRTQRLPCGQMMWLFNLVTWFIYIALFIWCEVLLIGLHEYKHRMIIQI